MLEGTLEGIERLLIKSLEKCQGKISSLAGQFSHKERPWKGFSPLNKRERNWK